MSVESPTRIAAPQVGRSMQRLDGREKLRGEAEFVGDMTVPRMLYGKVLRSPSRTPASSRSTPRAPRPCPAWPAC